MATAAQEPKSVLRIRRVRAVPTTVAPNTIYFVQAVIGGPLTIVSSSSDGLSISSTMSISDVQELVNRTQFVAFVDDLAGLDEFTAEYNAIVYVREVPGEDGPQAKVYLFDAETGAKVPMPGGGGGGGGGGDVNWVDIIGRPMSTAAAIDAAVANSHKHDNKAVLDGLGTANGRLTLGGAPVSNTSFIGSNW